MDGGGVGRFEEVNLRRREGIAKVVGTAICIGGAVTMSVYKGMALFGAGSDAAPDASVTQPFAHLGAFLHHDIVQFSVNKFHLGIFFLIMNCISWAVYLTYQVLPLSNLTRFSHNWSYLFKWHVSECQNCDVQVSRVLKTGTSKCAQL